MEQHDRSTTTFELSEYLRQELVDQLVIDCDVTHHVPQSLVDVIAMPHELAHEVMLEHRHCDTPRHAHFVRVMMARRRDDHTTRSEDVTRSQDVPAIMPWFRLEVRPM